MSLYAGRPVIVIKDSRVANWCMPERVDGLLLLGGPLEDEAPPVEMGAVPQGLHRALSLGRRLWVGESRNRVIIG